MARASGTPRLWVRPALRGDWDVVLSDLTLPPNGAGPMSHALRARCGGPRASGYRAGIAIPPGADRQGTCVEVAGHEEAVLAMVREVSPAVSAEAMPHDAPPGFRKPPRRRA